VGNLGGISRSEKVTTLSEDICTIQQSSWLKEKNNHHWAHLILVNILTIYTLYIVPDITIRDHPNEQRSTVFMV